jgi:hypothetical protein
VTEPKIVDAQYWTDWQADYIRDAVSRRDEAAARLVTAVGWFWTVYTAVALVGSGLAAQRSFHHWQTGIILAPIASLSVSYLSALWALNPITGSMKQTEKDARALWERLLKRKLFRLRLASVLLGLSAILIVAAGFIVASVEP